MVDRPDTGLRPVLRSGRSDEETAEAATVCPGAAITRPPLPEGVVAELADAWGAVLEMWEGYAADPEVRLAGSSGGVVTAFGIHAAEADDLAGVVHTRADEASPLRARTVLSTTRAQVLAGAGSRYAPAGPCDRLDLVEDAPGPVLVVGKPCDIAGLHAAALGRPALAAGIGVTVAVFCAGTPSTRGTLEMLEVMGVSGPDDVATLRYRGDGWPGDAVVTTHSGVPAEGRLDYDGSWNSVLQKHRQWRCRVCPDHTGELADVSVGDPWYRPVQAGDPGRSLVVVRTERGRALVAAARRSGAVVLERVDPGVLPASQPNLLRTRGAVAGRVATLRAAGRPFPRFAGFPMWRFWWSELPLEEKLRSTVGTLRRLPRRGGRRATPTVGAR